MVGYFFQLGGRLTIGAHVKNSPIGNATECKVTEGPQWPSG